MLIKRLNKALLVGLVLSSASMTATAGHGRFEDRARVVSVTPQVERINVPVQECRTEYVRESYYGNRRNSNGGAIVGTIAGGLIGSRFGGGNGRLITTAVGAGLGALIGDRHDNHYSQSGRERVETRPVESCVTVGRWETVNRGYLVDYKYRGRVYTTETINRPGRYLPVNVSVRPRGYVTHVNYRQHGNKHNSYKRRGNKNDRGHHNQKRNRKHY